MKARAFKKKATYMLPDPEDVSKFFNAGSKTVETHIVITIKNIAFVEDRPSLFS